MVKFFTPEAFARLSRGAIPNIHNKKDGGGHNYMYRRHPKTWTDESKAKQLI